MTEEYLSPAAREDEAFHRAELDAAREAAEQVARLAPLPRVTKAMRKSAPFSAQLADAIGKALAEYVYLVRRDEIAPLQRRLAELEQRKGLHDAGVWRPDKSYDADAIVSHGGSAWISQSKSEGSRPGEGSAWRLLVKRGRDGKPAKETRKIHAMA